MNSYRSKYSQLVYDLISTIPAGFVTTYGEIAQQLGMSSPRTVGTILHHNTNPMVVPCHRVVNAQGKTAQSFRFGGGDIQRQLLEQEGVRFIDDHVDFARHHHHWADFTR